MLSLMRTLLQDARFSLRLMRSRPGMAILVIAALVLGIGLNTAIFSVLNAVLLRPLPVFQPDRLLWLQTKLAKAGTPLGTSYPDFLDWRSQAHSLEAIAAMRPLSFTLSGSGSPEHLKAMAISASGFRVWGVSPILGRDFTADDDREGANRVVMLNYPFWQRKFGGDAGVLGKTLVLDDRQYTIIGVLQPTPLSVLKYPDVYVAIGPLIDQQIMERDSRYFFPVGRLKPDTSQTEAQAEMNAIAARLTTQFPETNKDMGIETQSMTERLTADGRKPLVLLIIISSLIFTLAAVNVMTLFVGATLARSQELSIRLALGAMRSDLLRQLLTQAAIFALPGGALGLAFAKLTLIFFLRNFPTAFARFQETGIDTTVILVTIATAFIACLIAALLPCLYALSLNPGSQLAGAKSSFALPKYRVLGRTALILFEVSLAAALCLISGLLIKSFYEVEKVDLGFSPSHVFSFQINPPLPRYKEPATRIALSKAALEKLTSLPGMALASASSSLPLTTQGQLNNLQVDSQSPAFGQQLVVQDEAILPGFFRTMKIPLLRGRDFEDGDHEGSLPVIIVDDLLAAKLWPGQDPLGKRLGVFIKNGDTLLWRQVVGVTKEIKHFGPERGARWMQVYVPQYQDPSPVLSFLVNTSFPAATVKSAAEKAIHELDKDMPVENFQTMDAYLDTILSGRKLNIFLLSIFAGIGIILGVIGVYGAVSDSVIRRRREIAIRMALGAQPLDTIILVTRFGFLTTLAGILIGSIIVVTFSRLFASLLYSVTAFDPMVYLFAAGILMLLSAIGSALPTGRLLRFKIQEILRQ